MMNWNNVAHDDGDDDSCDSDTNDIVVDDKYHQQIDVHNCNGSNASIARSSLELLLCRDVSSILYSGE